MNAEDDDTTRRNANIHGPLVVLWALIVAAALVFGPAYCGG